MNKILVQRKCKVEGCDNIYNTYKGSAKGYCVMHYRRFTRNGHPLKKKYSGVHFSPSTGYYYVSENNQKIKRSRHIMQQYLNRQLETHELVHHINGVKTDDRIENLQIVSRSEHAKIHH